MSNHKHKKVPSHWSPNWMAMVFIVAALGLFAWPSVQSLLTRIRPIGLTQASDGSTVGPATRSPSTNLVATGSNLVATGSKYARPLRSRTIAIEKLQVGDRVLAHNPEVSANERSEWSEPDWHQWLHLSLSMTKPDGSTLEIELLRPESWLREQLGLVVKPSSPKPESLATIADSNMFTLIRHGDGALPLSPLRPIFLDLALTDAVLEISGEELKAISVEMDLDEMAVTGAAVVHEILNAPPVKPGAGRVVTATFRHSSGDVIDLVVGNARQTTIADDLSQTSIDATSQNDATDTIGTTSNHPFWSVDRQVYVQAGDLEIGERLHTFSGDTKRVISKLARPGPQPVFNLEVFAEHVYYVGEHGLLVHNAYNKAGTVGDAAASRRAYLDQKFGRTGNLHADINARAGIQVASARDTAFATVKSVRRQVEKVMRADPNMQKLLANGDTMTYGFVFDARMKARLGVSGGRTPIVQGLEGTHAVIRPGGTYGVRGDYRMPDLRYRDQTGKITEYWDIKPASFTWNQQFADIQRWTGITPRPIGYNR